MNKTPYQKMVIKLRKEGLNKVPKRYKWPTGLYYTDNAGWDRFEETEDNQYGMHLNRVQKTGKKYKYEDT